MRVVTLLPSATEIVCTLDIDPVGVTHECDYPPRIASQSASFTEICTTGENLLNNQ